MEPTNQPTTRQEYQKQVEGHLKNWTARIEALQARVEKAGEATKKDLMDELVEFKKLQLTGKEHLEKIEAVAAVGWDEAKKGLTDTWNHVSGAADAIWARVKKDD
jgi:hypothetical protein